MTVASRSFGLLALEGASAGLCGWTLRSWARLEPYVAANVLPPAERELVFLYMGGAACFALASGLVLLVDKGARGLDLVHRLSHRLAPLALAAFLPLLLNWTLWRDRDLSFLVLAAIFVLSLQALVRLSLATPPLFDAPRVSPALAQLQSRTRRLAHSSGLPFALVVLGAVGYALFFSIHTINNHHNLGTAAFDLGIENNLVWNAVHGGPLFKTSPLLGPTSTHLGFHQTYFAYVIGLVYLFAPRPETLLVVQAVLLGAAAVPLYGLSTRRLGPWLGCLIAFTYLFYPPLHGSNLYDFHYLSFAPFFLWLTLYFLEEHRDGWAAVCCVLTLSVREDMSALLVIIGSYLLLRGERPKAGLVVSAVGAVYFIVVKLILMPRLLGGHASYIHQYQGLLPEGSTGFGGVLETVFGNPAFTLTSLLEKDKLIYLLQLIVPLAFVPWRRPVGLLCSVPGFFFTLLSTAYPPLIQISFQYTAYWTPFLFLAVIANLSELKPTRRAWVVALCAATLVTTHQYGAILQQNTVKGGFRPYRFGRTVDDRMRERDLDELIERVPPRAKIVATEMLVAHVSSRPDAYTLRTGIYDAEYILFTTLASRDELARVSSALGSGSFGVVAEKGDFVLARRGDPIAKNAAVLARLGR